MEIDIAKAFPVAVAIFGAIAGQISGRNKKNDAFIQLVEDLRNDYREVKDKNVELTKTVEDFKQTIIDLQNDRTADRKLIQELQTAREGDKRRMEDMQREIDTLRAQADMPPMPEKVADPLFVTEKTEAAKSGIRDTQQLKPIIPPSTEVTT